MLPTNTRIKKLRKALDLTQQAFADRLGIRQNTVAKYETGRGFPTRAVIALICREFNVSEKWLRTGEGEMFVQLSRDEEIASFVGGLLAEEEDNFRKRFIAMLSKLNVDDWEVLEKMAREMLQNYPAEPVDQRAAWEAEAREVAELAYQEYLEQKKAEAGYSASPPTGSGDLLA